MQLDFWVVQLYLKDLCAVTVESGRLRSAPEKLLQLPPSNSPNVTDNPPLGNRPEKSLQLPPPSNSPNVTDDNTPSWKSAWEITPTTPPRITPNVEFVQLEKILRITPVIYQLNQLGSKAASESTFKKSNTFGVSNTRLYLKIMFSTRPNGADKNGWQLYLYKTCTTIVNPCLYSEEHGWAVWRN